MSRDTLHFLYIHEHDSNGRWPKVLLAAIVKLDKVKIN